MVVRYLKALRSFLRIPTYLLMLLYYTIGFIGAMGIYRWWEFALGAAAIAAWYINATSVNDFSDFEIDQINLRGDASRPLVTGALTRVEIKAVAVGSALASLLLAAPLGWPALVLTAALLLLNLVYSMPPLAVSRRGGLALLLLPVGYIILSMGLGSLAAGRLPAGPALYLITVCYAQFMARLSLKDYRDVAGDAKFGKRTYLLRHGSRAVIRLALVCHVAAATGGLVWLYAGSSLRAVAYIFLASAGLVLLLRLGKASTWSTQRIWITAYGRTASGQVSIVLLDTLARAHLVGTQPQQNLLLILLVASFAWSTQQVVARSAVTKP